MDIDIRSDPFPHMICDGFFEDDSFLRQVVAEWPAETDPRWRRYDAPDERGKLEGSDPAMWSPAMDTLMNTLAAPDLRQSLSTWLCGGAELVPDAYGGGYHQIAPGGRLAMHADFNVHPGLPSGAPLQSGPYLRVVNALLYLNDGWQDGMGGELEIADPEGWSAVVEPVWNRLVAFQTSDISWHGHPNIWTAPFPRRSVALYYYRKIGVEEQVNAHSTAWMPKVLDVAASPV